MPRFCTGRKENNISCASCQKILCACRNLNEQFQSEVMTAQQNQKPTNIDHLITVIMQMASFYNGNTAKTSALEVTPTFSYQCAVLSHIQLHCAFHALISKKL